MDRAIQNWFRDEHRLLIGERMAEIIKQNLNKLSFDIEGRSADDGFRKRYAQTARSCGRLHKEGKRRSFALLKMP